MANIELKITMNERGEINVSGPINDKLLSYGLLEIAKQIIQAHVPTQLPNQIVQPPNGMKIQR